MLELTRLLFGFLLVGHLAILVSSQLQKFGHPLANKICSNTFDLCDDPVWVASMATLLLAAYVCVPWMAKLGSRSPPTPDVQTVGSTRATSPDVQTQVATPDA